MSRAEIALGVIGVGTIGSSWLDQFAGQLSLASHAQVTAIFRSSCWLDAPRGVNLDSWREQLANSAEAGSAADVQTWLQRCREREQQPVLIDLTASKQVSRSYPGWVAAGAHVICANKYAGSSDLSWYRDFRRVLDQYQRHWLYNTTVGAGLPILSALQERCLCGDKVLRIEGNLSGSLSWIFQQFRAGEKLSDWLAKAQEEGLTEPDPRLDLGGMDVARKLVILAREVGWPLQLKDLSIHNLVPPELRECTTQEFVGQGEAFDKSFESWRQHECPEAKQWVYLGYICQDDDGHYHGGTELVPIESTSVYANLPGGNANFTVRTQQYDANPLVIQGPGAGPEVTAAGVHSDVLQLIARLKKH
ncbi:hypothetical protein J6I90_08520 [Pseudidiomarina sp. 1APP75-32.1]|uniref:homoserine dehydrogenase n=1 Tax=Pseudidiomarina terrestris TaxID=2820060 RepID=A0AAW7QXG9_9GAMM|nr:MULTISPECIES: hypothetical protein [unclassified Pseudidiomarina]MDN7124925.1 hypothetical protein [Pseudidiomarina sp. 1APP75-32.1]MDN7129602.1 hypothetical protein [Pseudidiomarina sp. 1APR75-15]